MFFFNVLIIRQSQSREMGLIVACFFAIMHLYFIKTVLWSYHIEMNSYCIKCFTYRRI